MSFWMRRSPSTNWGRCINVYWTYILFSSALAGDVHELVRLSIVRSGRAERGTSSAAWGEMMDCTCDDDTCRSRAELRWTWWRKGSDINMLGHRWILNANKNPPEGFTVRPLIFDAFHRVAIWLECLQVERNGPLQIKIEICVTSR